MKYDTPELTTLTAINAIQSSGSGGSKSNIDELADSGVNEVVGAYMDWED
jgi:hypothetical protein